MLHGAAAAVIISAQVPTTRGEDPNAPPVQVFCGVEVNFVVAIPLA